MHKNASRLHDLRVKQSPYGQIS